MGTPETDLHKPAVPATDLSPSHARVPMVRSSLPQRAGVRPFGAGFPLPLTPRGNDERSECSPNCSYPRRLRAWHDPPCLGSRGGCRLQGVRLSLRTGGRSPISLAWQAARPAERRSRVRIAASGAFEPIPYVSGQRALNAPLLPSSKPSSGKAAARSKALVRWAPG